MIDLYPYYMRDGTRVSIDYKTLEGRDLSQKLWSHEYRRVAQDYVGKIHISTVFLPIDHGWYPPNEEHVPILFETMVFGYDGRSPLRRWWENFRGREHDEEYQWRYPTEADALEGHRRIVEAVSKGRLTHDTIPYHFTREEA